MDRCSSLLAPLLATLLLSSAPARAGEIWVPDDHAKIQQAILASSNGDVIRVRPGTYMERIDFLGKAITLESEQGPELTTIHAGFNGGVVSFLSGEGRDSVLRGFTLTGGTGCVSVFWAVSYTHLTLPTKA